MPDLTFAASADAVAELFAHVRDTFHFVDEGSVDDGSGMVVHYEIDLRLEHGSIDLRNDNTIRIAELDLVPEQLAVTLEIRIPEICIPGYCIVPSVFGGCAWRAPDICLYDADPDLSLRVEVGPHFRSEISFVGSLFTQLGHHQYRPPDLDDATAEAIGLYDQWQILIDVETIDFDLFDVADIVGGMLEEAIGDAIDAATPVMPGWAVDLFEAMVGPPLDMVVAILDLPDDLQEWLSDLLDVGLSIKDLVGASMLDHYSRDNPLHVFDSKLEVLPSDGLLIPVLVPVDELTVSVDDNEMVLEATFGEAS